MEFPTLTELQTSREMIDTFRGYNHNLRIGDGEFYDMKNMVSSYYPVLSPRPRRGIYSNPSSPQGMICKDALCYVDGADLYVNGAAVEGLVLSTHETMCPKDLISMGAYVIIMPDRKYVNTKDLTDYGEIDAVFATEAPVTFELCKLDGSTYGEPSTSEPSDPIDGALWIDTSSTPHTLKQYSKASSMWVSVATTYIKISSAGIGAAFEKYDGITIQGLGEGFILHDNATGAVIEDSELSAINGSFVIWDKGDDYIVVVGILDVTRTISDSISIFRVMPTMDFIVESENRLWGCRYGFNANGDVVNEIYASKLGDFKNWNCFMGLSTDSYVASCGTDGQFTGAITHLGYPLFFKENFVHKVYGNFPANYQIQTTACRGVQKGSSRSLAIVNEILYYKSRGGVCAYDGSLPTEMSSQLGEEAYSEAVAGAHGNKYYISMKDSAGEYHLFVYDTAKGMWHREDNTQAESFCSCGNEMYYIDSADKTIRTVFGSGMPTTEPVEWMAETGIIGASSPDKKYISRLTVRMSLDLGTQVDFYAQYDSLGEWEHLCTMTGTQLRSFAVPIRPKRCDHLRLRIEGKGDAKIYSITKTIEEGSDVR